MPVPLQAWLDHVTIPTTEHDLTLNTNPTEVWSCGCGCVILPTIDSTEVYPDRYILRTVDPDHDCACHLDTNG